jgi:hypothetical protein
MTFREIADRQSSSDRRRWDRFGFGEATSAILHAEGVDLPCALEDLSVGGVKVRLSTPAPASERLELRHAIAGSFPLRRAWQKDQHAGYCFDLAEESRSHILQCISLFLHPDSGIERAA